MLQQTIKYSGTLSGVGVHSGTKCIATLRPAPPHTGVVFVIQDEHIPARLENISDTRLCTTLGHTRKVATIEHIMASLVGAGVDNIFIEVTGPEIPVMDGSASDFFFLLESLGREVSDVPSIVFMPTEAVRIDVGNRYCMLEPSESYELNYCFESYGSQCVMDHPRAHFSFASDSFEHQLARARTFGMIDDYPKLQAMHCALGTSMDNTIALDARGPLNPSGLRWDNEPARHKLLDAVGDLALLGLRLKATFTGFGSGHAMHYALMKKIMDLQVLVETTV